MKAVNFIVDRRLKELEELKIEVKERIKSKEENKFLPGLHSDRQELKSIDEMIRINKEAPILLNMVAAAGRNK